MTAGLSRALGEKTRWLAPLKALAFGLTTAVLLSACAPLVQQVGRPDLGFQGPRIEDHDFVSFDGAHLGLQTWEPDSRAPEASDPWAVIIGLHGMDDYANAFHLAGPYWAKDGIVTLAYDQRGFGRSPHRGVWAGQDLMTEDLRTLTALARRRYPRAVIAVVGESMGGAVAAAAFASDRPPPADRLVLVSPAVWGWSSQPLPNKASLWLLAHLDGAAVINPPKFIYRHIRASDNIEELIAMGRDPMMIWGARTDTLYGLVSLMQTAAQSVGQGPAPILYLAGQHDQIIPREPTLSAAKHLRPTDRSVYYPNGWHLLLVDHQAATVWRDIEGFIRDPSAPVASGAAPLPGAPAPSAPGSQASR